MGIPADIEQIRVALDTASQQASDQEGLEIVSAVADAGLRLCGVVERIVVEAAVHTGTFAPVAGIEIDTDELGSALERGIDSLSRDVTDAIQRGFSEMAASIERIEVTR